MARQSSRTRGDGNQDRSLRAAFASLRRAVIGTGRREYLNRILFWTAADLETKLLDFQHYYNGHRTHAGREGRLQVPVVAGAVSPIGLDSYQWRKHCRGLYQTPMAA